MFGWSYCFRILRADSHSPLRHRAALTKPAAAEGNPPRFRQEPDFQLWGQIFLAGFDSDGRLVPLQRSFEHLGEVALATGKQQGNIGGGDRKVKRVLKRG